MTKYDLYDIGFTQVIGWVEMKEAPATVEEFKVMLAPEYEVKDISGSELEGEFSLEPMEQDRELVFRVNH